MTFQPTFQKHAGDACGGVQLHVLERDSFLPVLTGLAVMIEIRRQSPMKFAWRQPPYEYEHDKLPIDILSGTPALRQQIEQGASAHAIAATWKSDEGEFKRVRTEYPLYDGL